MAPIVPLSAHRSQSVTATPSPLVDKQVRVARALQRAGVLTSDDIPLVERIALRCQDDFHSRETLNYCLNGSVMQLAPEWMQRERTHLPRDNRWNTCLPTYRPYFVSRDADQVGLELRLAGRNNVRTPRERCDLARSAWGVWVHDETGKTLVGWTDPSLCGPDEEFWVRYGLRDECNFTHHCHNGIDRPGPGTPIQLLQELLNDERRAMARSTPRVAQSTSSDPCQSRALPQEKPDSASASAFFEDERPSNPFPFEVGPPPLAPPLPAAKDDALIPWCEPSVESPPPTKAKRPRSSTRVETHSDLELSLAGVVRQQLNIDVNAGNTSTAIGPFIPTGTARVQATQVDVNPDGTMSLRIGFSLQGELPIEFTVPLSVDASRSSAAVASLTSASVGKAPKPQAKEKRASKPKTAAVQKDN